MITSTQNTEGKTEGDYHTSTQTIQQTKCKEPEQTLKDKFLEWIS